MTYLIAFIVCFVAGIGAGLGTGFAGMSAAAVISPMLITFLGMDPYMAVGIALASDVLASAVSAYTYGKSGNLDIKNGAVMMASVLCFTLVGSYVASLVPGRTMGGFSTFMTLLLGVKFIVRPVMTTKSSMNAVSAEKRFVQSLLCGAGVGFICGNGDHNLVNIGKAGRKRHMGIRPTVRGSVMNPNDHPHGGGEGKAPVGRPGPCTPWGKPALGLKTRKKNKQSNKLIVRRRDGRAIK